MVNIGGNGCCYVGRAIKVWLEHNKPECKEFISDPYKDRIGDSLAII